MADEAGRRRGAKVTDATEKTLSPRADKASSSEEPVSPRSGASANRTRLGSSKDSPSKDSPKADKDKEKKSKDKDKDKDKDRNKHARERTAQRQNSIMPVPMPSPDKVEEIFVKLLVRYRIFPLLLLLHDL